MPIYEYTCRKCGSAFEHLARSSSEAAPKCPRCGAANPQKQLSTFSAIAGGNDSIIPPCSIGTCPTGGCPSEMCPAGTCPLN